MLARIPDNLFPTEFAKKNPPIIKAVNLAGDNLETNDNPIGERQSSPIVTTPYPAINQSAETFSAPLFQFWGRASVLEPVAQTPCAQAYP